MHLCVLLKSDSRLRRWLCLACLPEWLTVALLCVALWCLVPEWPNGKKTNQDFVLHFVTTLLIWSFNFNCFYCICVTFSAESLKQKTDLCEPHDLCPSLNWGITYWGGPPSCQLTLRRMLPFCKWSLHFSKPSIHSRLTDIEINASFSQKNRWKCDGVISFFSLNFSHGGKHFNWKGCNYWHHIESLGSIKCQKM